MTDFDRSAHVTTGQAADIIGVSAETIRRWCVEGRMAAIRTATGRWLIHRDVLAEFLPKPGGAQT